MSLIGNTYADLREKYNTEGEDAANVIELLSMTNPILQDALAVECNAGTGHEHSIRTGLPSVSWGSLYQGIPQSKGRMAKVTDSTGYLEALSSTDTRVLELCQDDKHKSAIMLNEAAPFIEAMNQEMATGMFYHDTATTPEKFKGLSARFNVIGGGGAGNQVIDAGGTGSDNTSLWMVGWGDHSCHLLYPQGTKAGIQRNMRGEQRISTTLDSGETGSYMALEEEYRWHIGMAVKDWRYVTRISNIDLNKVEDGTTDIYALMRKAYYKLQSRTRREGGAMSYSPVIYGNRDITEALDAKASNAGSSDNFVRLTPKEIAGEEVLTYRGLPIRECDALLNTEQRVLNAA